MQNDPLKCLFSKVSEQGESQDWHGKCDNHAAISSTFVFVAGPVFLTFDVSRDFSQPTNVAEIWEHHWHWILPGTRSKTVGWEPPLLRGTCRDQSGDVAGV